MDACVKWKWFKCQKGGMTPWVVCLVHVSIFGKPLGSASDLLVVHLCKVGVRPSPVRKEVEMTTTPPSSPQTDQPHQKEEFTKKKTKFIP